MGNTKIPLYSTIVGVLVSIILAIIFGFILNWGVFGLAFASSIGGIMSFVYLYLISKFEIDKKEVFETILKSVLSAVFMAAAVLGIKFLTGNLYIQVFGGITIAIIVYFGIAYLLKENSVLMLKKLRK